MVSVNGGTKGLRKVGHSMITSLSGKRTETLSPEEKIGPVRDALSTFGGGGELTSRRA